MPCTIGIENYTQGAVVYLKRNDDYDEYERCKLENM